MLDENSNSPIVVTHDAGARFTVQVRSHRLIVDQPHSGGGEDSGPMPIELLGASLGSCIAFYVQKFLQSRELPSAGMRVEVEQRSERKPSRVAEFIVRVVLPTPIPGAYAEMLERVARSCPAHNTLERSARVHVSIETPALAAT